MFYVDFVVRGSAMIRQFQIVSEFELDQIMLNPNYYDIHFKEV